MKWKKGRGRWEILGTSGSEKRWALGEADDGVVCVMGVTVLGAGPEGARAWPECHSKSMDSLFFVTRSH